MKGFPGVVGAIDGTHIPIKAPKENPNDYINCKFFHSIQLQAVFDADLLCTDAFCGFPGRIHDARAFRNSPLFEDARSGPDELFPGNTHILGDSAYPLQKWLMTPFKNYGNLNRDHKRYNFRQSSTRMVIEHFWNFKRAASQVEKLPGRE